MNGPTHASAGIAAGCIIAVATRPHLDVLTVGIVVSLHASLFSDWLQISYPLITIPGFEGHRGFSHWILSAFIIALLIGNRYPELAPYWLFGHLSHILLDSFTFVGIPMFGPWPKRFNIINSQNGGRLDSFLGRMCFAISVICLFTVVCR